MAWEDGGGARTIDRIRVTRYPREEVIGALLHAYGVRNEHGVSLPTDHVAHLKKLSRYGVWQRLDPNILEELERGTQRYAEGSLHAAASSSNTRAHLETLPGASFSDSLARFRETPGASSSGSGGLSNSDIERVTEGGSSSGVEELGKFAKFAKLG